MSSRFGTKEEVLARLDGLRRFNEWEESHPRRLTPQQALAAVGALYDLLPEAYRDVRDPEKARHLRATYDALGRLQGRG